MADSQDLTVSIGSSPVEVRVTVSGDVDLPVAPLLESLLLSAIEHAGARPVVVDLGAVAFLDSMGLRALMTARHRCDERDVVLTVENPSERVQQVLALTGADEALLHDGPDHPS